MKIFKKFIIYSSLALYTTLIGGCAISSLGDGINSKPMKQDPSLPTVKSIQTLSDMSAVAFEWIPLSDSSDIVGYKIYRLNSVDGNGSAKLINVANLKDRAISHYVDTNLKPNTLYQYRFTAYTSDDRESKGSKTVKARTQPAIQPINYIISVGNLANKIKLLWRPHQSQRVAGYIIERSSIYNPKWIEIATVKNRFNVEYIDYGLENDRLYKYRLRVKTFDGIVSKPSKTVEVETKDLPKPIKNIETTFDMPKQIRVSWQVSKEKDIRTYRVYRSFEHDAKFDLIKETKDNFYLDRLSEDGQRAFYKVSVVDKDGLESILPDLSIDGSTLRKPSTPKLIKIISSERDITLFWDSTDNRSRQYKIIRKKKSGWITVETKEFLTKETKFVDREVKPKDTYSYQVLSIDRYGITSKPTEESEKSLRVE